MGKGIVSAVVISLAFPEVKEPRRTIPFAIVGGIVFAAVVSLLIGAAVLAVLGPESMRGGDTANDTPLLTAGAQAIAR